MRREISQIALFLFLTLNLLAQENIKELKIINRFPNYNQPEKIGYVMGRTALFDLNNDSIYVCSQFLHQIIQLDHEGNLIRCFGRKGQGPGDFNLPLRIFIYEQKLYISDNGNSRIQIFSIDGKYERQLKMIEPLMDFVIINDKIFLLMPTRLDKNAEINPIFGVFNLAGELEISIKEPFHSRYKDFYKDNIVTLRASGQDIHCLQKFGTAYRIYNVNGQLKKEFNLKINPFEDREYNKIGHLFTYKTFCLHDNKIYTSIAAKGKILIYVFNMNGDLIYSYLSKQEKDELYDILDMRIFRRNDKSVLYILLQCCPVIS